jgi:hypothetical protein
MSIDTLSGSARAVAREHLPRAEEFLRWPPGLQAYGYRIVDKLFASRAVPCGPAPRALPRAAEIDTRL